MVKVADSSVQIQNFLRSFLPLEFLLVSFLTPCRSVRLLNDVVAPACGDHQQVIDVDQARERSNRGSVAAERVGMDDLWNGVFRFWQVNRGWA